jgi:hypothetical protein
MPQCCVSEKLHRKYSRNWTKQKPKFLFFPTQDGVQSSDGGGPAGRRTIGWRGLPRQQAGAPYGPCHQVVWPPGPPPDAALPPIYSPRRENLKPDQFSRKHTASRRHRRCEIGRVQKLFLAPCRRGESPPEAFFTTMLASGVMCE